MKNTPPHTQYGYTLFELLVVLLILTGALALSGSLYFRSAPSLQGQLIAKTIASELQQTRSAAISNNHSRQWTGSDLHTMLSGSGAVNDRISFQFTPNASAQTEDGAFVFHPDGSANGGRISVIAPKRQWDINISLSGRVTVDEGRKE